MTVESMESRLFRAVLAFLGFLSALPILGLIVAGMAWNGTNFAVDTYLLIAGVGTIGLLAGSFTAFSSKTVFAWITGISGALLACLSLFFLSAFLLNPPEGKYWNNPLRVGPISAPLFVFYGVMVVCCSAITLVCLKKIRSVEVFE